MPMIFETVWERAEPDVPGYLPLSKEFSFWRDIGRLEMIGLRINRSRKEIESQLIWRVSWIDRLHAVDLRLNEMERAA